MTPLQHRLLAYLDEQQRVGMMMPTMAEMTAALGKPAASRSNMVPLLNALELEGWISRNARQRSVRVLRRVPVRGLSAVELEWCATHPERVRALMGNATEADHGAQVG